MDYQTQLDWLITMASNPGFKQYAWNMAKQCEADHPGIAQALKDHMIGQVKDLASDNPTQQKPNSVGKK